MTQQMMAELFQTSKQNIGQHIANILQDVELQEDRTVKNFFTVRLGGGHAKSRREIFLHEWESKLDELLTLIGRRVMRGKGKRSRKQAQAYVREQYELYEERRRLLTEQQAEQDYVRELEKDIKKLENTKRSKT